MLKRVSDKENISLQVDSLLRAIDEKKQRIEAIQASTASLLKQSENILAGTTSTVDSRTAYAISLYSKITNITWDYNAPADKIVGCKPFHSYNVFFPFILSSLPRCKR